MLASEMISNVVPILKKTDSCWQALNWMEIFRVSHLPVTEGDSYVGLLSDELVYEHGDLDEAIEKLNIPAEGTFVYEDYHIYDVMGLAASKLLSVVPVLSRKNVFSGSVLATNMLHDAGRLLCVDKPGGIIVLEVNSIDYSLAEVAQVVEYNEAKILSCYVSGEEDSKRMSLTIKVNTLNMTPLLDTFIRYNYTVKNSFVTGEESGDILKERYGLLMKYLSI